MRKSQYSDEQIVKIVRESHAQGVAETAKKYKVSENAIYIWRRKFGGMEPNQVSELKRIMQENARLKKIVAERDLEIEVMKEIAAKQPTRSSCASSRNASSSSNSASVSPGKPAMKVLRMVSSGHIARHALMRASVFSLLAGRFINFKMSLLPDCNGI